MKADQPMIVVQADGPALSPLIACLDVHYGHDKAAAAALWFRDWTACAVEHRATAIIGDAQPYRPGEFYRRELPALLRVLSHGPRPDIVIIDGYVWLSAGAPGLGAHLHEQTGRPVVGIAKTRFADANAMQVVRGSSSRSPLFVTAVGIPTHVAADGLARMHGPFRIPSMLKQADTMARAVNLELDGTVGTQVGNRIRVIGGS